MVVALAVHEARVDGGTGDPGTGRLPLEEVVRHEGSAGDSSHEVPTVVDGGTAVELVQNQADELAVARLTGKVACGMCPSLALSVRRDDDGAVGVGERVE